MLEQTLNSNQFEQALDLLKNGEKLSKSLEDFKKSQIFEKLLREKQFEILLHFCKDKTIQTDVYELDNFDRSIFQSILYYLPKDEESISFFRDFISKFDNLNDEVATKTLLGFFLEKGANLDFIKILVEAGCDVNFQNNAEENYLHQVIKTNLMKPDLSLSYLEFLINEGLDVNHPNIVKKTPLISAIDFNRDEYIDLLLQNGANPNDADKDGNSAFFYAVAHKLDFDLYTQLRDFATPDLDHLNNDQVSALFEFTRMMNGRSDREIKLLIQMIEDGGDLYHPSQYYSKDKTPLDQIAEKPSEILEAVLETGKIEINRQDDNGNTLLHKVCAFNVNFDAEQAKETYRKVKLLLENDADSSITNDQDKTALMLASDDNLKIKTVELLMKK
jgi:ankyrin repeat protein